MGKRCRQPKACCQQQVGAFRAGDDDSTWETSWRKHLWSENEILGRDNGVFAIESRQVLGVYQAIRCAIRRLSILAYKHPLSMSLLRMKHLLSPKAAILHLKKFIISCRVINKRKLILLLFNNKTIKCNQPSESLLLTLAIFILTWPHNNCMIWWGKKGRKINFRNAFLSVFPWRVERRRGRSERRKFIHLRCCKRLKKGEMKWNLYSLCLGWKGRQMKHHDKSALMGSNKYSWEVEYERRGLCGVDEVRGATICS